jgi:hypothetical protein
MLSRVALARFLGIVAALAAAGLASCASKAKPYPAVAVSAGKYAEAFEVAKDALREFQFDLDRVDAAGGIVTTHARGSAGFATPWVPHTSSLGESARGFVERERRRAAVVFQPAGATLPDTAAGTPETGLGKPIDLALEPMNPEAEMTAHVRVWIERVYRPGRRVSATSVRLSSFTSDPELREQGLEPAFAVETKSDSALEGRIASWISGRLAGLGQQ